MLCCGVRLLTPDGLFAFVLWKSLLWHQLWHTNRQVAGGGAGKRHAVEVLTQNSSGNILLGRDGFLGLFN